MKDAFVGNIFSFFKHCVPLRACVAATRYQSKCTLSKIGVLGPDACIIIKQQFVLATLPVATTTPTRRVSSRKTPASPPPIFTPGSARGSWQLAQKWTPKDRQVPDVPAKHSTRFTHRAVMLSSRHRQKQASSLTKLFDRCAPCSVITFPSFYAEGLHNNVAPKS